MGKNVGAENCNFSTKEIMGVQNFNLVPKFPQNRNFCSPNFCTLKYNFLTNMHLYSP